MVTRERSHGNLRTDKSGSRRRFDPVTAIRTTGKNKTHGTPKPSRTIGGVAVGPLGRLGGRGRCGEERHRVRRMAESMHVRWPSASEVAMAPPMVLKMIRALPRAGSDTTVVETLLVK